jgi:1-acyl-sn-glycerol-3-phosphate acyltransferase
MLRVILVGGFFFGTLPFMIALQWLLGRLNAPTWGPCSVAYYRLLTRLLRIRIATQGTRVTGRPVLIVSNHISWLDIVVLASVAPMVFVAKSEVASWPLIGAAAKVQKVVFVDRKRRHQTPATVAEIAARLKEGHPVVLFAEGTSSDGNRVLPFRTALIGAVETACNEAGQNLKGLGEVTLQPMSICYTNFQGIPMGRQKRPVVAWYGDLDFFPHFAQFLRQGVIDVTVSFGSPVAATADVDRKEIARTLETSVRNMTASVLRGRAIPATT